MTPPDMDDVKPTFATILATGAATAVPSDFFCQRGTGTAARGYATGG
jgi:hypothetical protein